MTSAKKKLNFLLLQMSLLILKNASKNGSTGVAKHFYILREVMIKDKFKFRLWGSVFSSLKLFS